MADDYDDYKLGPGRPPLHTRFRKGQSGNPGGRSKKKLHANRRASPLEAASPARLSSSKAGTPPANWSRDNTTYGDSLPVPPLSKTACAVSAAAWALSGHGRARALRSPEPFLLR
jgi:hypothetical protein